MSYKDFLAAFADVQALESVEDLLNKHSKRYSFQINSRDRAKNAIAMLDQKLGLRWTDLRVLDVGCAYGAFTIELAKRGAKAVGIELSDKWLRLAKINAQDEIDIPFIHCDASSRQARQQLRQYGPFDVVLLNDVFEHIYDTAGLLSNIRFLMKPGGTLYFKVPNGMATRHVLLEGHKGVFGISLLAPDYWQRFVKAPFHIYYRRWEYFAALFNEFGFQDLQILNGNTDENLDATRSHILRDMEAIKEHLKSDKFVTAEQLKTARTACQRYFEEVTEDLECMGWRELHFKYRVTFWEGIITLSINASEGMSSPFFWIKRKLLNNE
jgi:2-polyprenyl-3-methyl-5-hydroxy-6-metoxy-1,4-benzoquinol methylase